MCGGLTRDAFHAVLAVCAVAAACLGMAENEAFAQVSVESITYKETFSAGGVLTVYFNDTIDTDSMDGSKFRVHYHHSLCNPTPLDPDCSYQDYWLAINFFASPTHSAGCHRVTITNMSIACSDHGGTIHDFYKKDHRIELDIDAGAVNSTDNIPIAESKNLPITVLNTKVSLGTLTYLDAPSGRLIVYFNGWPSTTTYDLSKMHLRPEGSDSGGVPLSSSLDTSELAIDDILVFFDKSTSERIHRMIYPSPGVVKTVQLDIDRGAVSDVYGTPIERTHNVNLLVFDDWQPAVTSAVWSNDTGTVSVSFDEAVKIHPVQANIAVYNSSNATDYVSLYDGGKTDNVKNPAALCACTPSSCTWESCGTTAFANMTSGLVLAMNVTNDTRAKIFSYGDDRMIRMNNAIYDGSGNRIDPFTAVPLTFPMPAIPPVTPTTPSPAPVSTPIVPVPIGILDVATDRTPPGMVSASYDASASVLSVVFDEPASVDSSGITLRGGFGALTLGAAPSGYNSQISVSATGINTGNMTLDVRSGAVLDASGNAMPRYSGFPVGLVRPDAPVVVAAEYDFARGLLDISFDRTVTLGAASLFAVDGVPLNPGEYQETFFSSSTMYFLLDVNRRDTLSPGSVLSVGAGAALAATGERSLAADIPISYLGTGVSADDMSLVYSTVTGTLWIDVPAEYVTVDSYTVTVRDSDTSYGLHQMDSMLNGATLSSGGKVLSGNSPIFADIGAKSVVANFQLVPPARNIPVAIFDGIGTDVIRQSPIPNATGLWAAGPGLVLASTPSHIWVLDVGEPASPKNITQIPMNGTRVLDVTSIPDTASVAVLTGDSVRFLDLESPASPRWAGSVDTARNATWGAVSNVVVNDLPHVVSVTPDRITLAHVSDVDSPKAVSSAAISRNPPPGFGAASFGSGIVYTSVRSSMLCSVNLESGEGYAATCRGHAGNVGPVAAATVGDTQLVMSGGTGTVSIRTPDLQESYSVRTGAAPTAIETVTIYDTPYMLVTAGALYAFDITGEPILDATAGSYRSVAVVVGKDGLPYAALLGPGGLSVMDLAGLK